MKIKSMIAGLLAGVLMMGNLSAVCFAADNSPVSTEGDAGDRGCGDSPRWNGRDCRGRCGD